MKHFDLEAIETEKMFRKIVTFYVFLFKFYFKLIIKILDFNK